MYGCLIQRRFQNSWKADAKHWISNRLARQVCTCPASLDRAEPQPDLQQRNADSLEISECRVVIVRVAGWIVVVTFGDHNDHPLACAGEQYTISVLEVLLTSGLLDAIPTGAYKRKVLPFVRHPSQVGIPNYTT